MKCTKLYLVIFILPDVLESERALLPLAAKLELHAATDHVVQLHELLIVILSRFRHALVLGVRMGGGGCWSWMLEAHAPYMRTGDEESRLRLMQSMRQQG